MIIVILKSTEREKTISPQEDKQCSLGVFLQQSICQGVGFWAILDLFHVKHALCRWAAFFGWTCSVHSDSVGL